MGGSHVRTIPTYTSKSELITLYNLAKSCPNNSIGLEIGSHYGASSCYITAGFRHNNGHLFCVDTWMNDNMPDDKIDTMSIFLSNIKFLEKSISVIRKKSCDLHEKDLILPVDFVFIDGDHDYEGVKGDYNLVMQFVSKNAIIAFHDIDREGVSKVLGEALFHDNWILAGIDKNLCWLKQKTR